MSGPHVSEQVNGLAAALDGVVDDLADLDPAGLDDASLRVLLLTTSRVIDRLDGVRARGLDAGVSSGMVERDGAATGSAWLRTHTNVGKSRAGRIGRAARRTRDLPVLTDAWTDGRIGLGHMSAVDRLAADVPLSDIQAVENELVTVAEETRGVDGFARICRGWRAALAPDALDGRDERAWANRWASWAPTTDGIVDVRMRLDPVDGAAVVAAFEAFVTPDPPGTPDDARRHLGARRADAVAAAARTLLSLTKLPSGETGAARPHVVVRADADSPTLHTAVTGGHPDLRPLTERSVRPAEIDGIGPVSARVVAELLGDCWITPLVTRDHGWTPVTIGTAARTWTPAQRRVITDRDRACRFPGCDRTPAACEIDHITPAAHHGPTHPDNGILICRYHHRHTKHRDRWWPTLHPDTTVTWRHADGRTITDPPPATTDTAARRLLTALADARIQLADHNGHDPTIDHPGHGSTDPDPPPDTAADERAPYDVTPRQATRRERSGRARAGPQRGLRSRQMSRRSLAHRVSS